MARRSTGGISGRPSMLLLLTLLSSIVPAQAFGFLNLLPRSSDACPTSYGSCSNTKLPDNFCCPSDSTCISLDNASSLICCPVGGDCHYISPIVCDIQEQNVTLNPDSAIKTTRLSDSLPICGDACCPFGYTCQGDNTCALDKAAAITATPSIFRPSISTFLPTEATATTSISTSTTLEETITPVPSPSSQKSAKPIVADTSTTTTTPVPSSSGKSANSTATDPSTSHTGFPAKAIAVGFFPGTIFGVVITLLVSLCARRGAHKSETEMQEPRKKPPTAPTSPEGLHELNAVPSESPHELNAVPSVEFPPIRRTSSRVRNPFSDYPPAYPRLDNDVTLVPMTAPFNGDVARPDTTFTGSIHVRHSPDGRPCYPIVKDLRQNPFRDPDY